MCLGDLRFQPYLRWVDRGTITTSTAAQKLIPRNPQRAGLALGWSGNDMYLWPGDVSPGNTTGFYMDNSGGGAHSWLFPYSVWGAVIQQAWWVSTGTNGQIRYADIEAPEEIFAWIRKLKLSEYAPSGFP
jgi:hypothetical protein